MKRTLTLDDYKEFPIAYDAMQKAGYVKTETDMETGEAWYYFSDGVVLRLLGDLWKKLYN